MRAASLFLNTKYIPSATLVNLNISVIYDFIDKMYKTKFYNLLRGTSDDKKNLFSSLSFSRNFKIVGVLFFSKEI